MKMPPPIATKFTKLVLTILAITILGIILSFVSQDHTLLMLSAGVAEAELSHGRMALGGSSELRGDQQGLHQTHQALSL